MLGVVTDKVARFTDKRTPDAMKATFTALDATKVAFMAWQTGGATARGWP